MRLSKKIRLHWGINAILFFLIASLTASIIFTLYQKSELTAQSWAFTLFKTETKKIANNVSHLLEKSSLVTRINGASPLLNRALPKDSLHHEVLDPFIQTLDYDHNLYSIYFGFDSGDFFQVIAIRGDEQLQTAHKAPGGNHRKASKHSSVFLQSQPLL